MAVMTIPTPQREYHSEGDVGVLSSNVLLLGPRGRHVEAGAPAPHTLPAMTLAEALETTHIPRVGGLTGGRTALVTSCCSGVVPTIAPPLARRWWSYGHRPRMGSQQNYLAGGLDLVALAALAERR
jgi:hypothetical protein